MIYREFIKRIAESLYSQEVKMQCLVLGVPVSILEDNTIVMNHRKTNFTSLNEVREFIKEFDLKESVRTEAFKTIPSNTVATIIREHSNDKITNVLLESYLQQAIAREFTTDPIVLKLRNLFPIESINSKIDFVLEDGSIVAISKTLLERLSSKNDKYIEDMRKSIDSFTHSIRNIIEAAEHTEQE